MRSTRPGFALRQKSHRLARFAFILSGLLFSLPAAAEEPPRVAALDWGAVELLLGLGIVPVAVTQPDGYNRNVVAPVLPKGVADLGLVVEPNLEVLAGLRPDLILASPLQVAGQGEALRRIAPTDTVSVYGQAGRPYDLAKAETRRIAERLGRLPQAEALEARTEAALDRAAKAACPGDTRPVYLIWIVDHRNVVVYGTTSLFQTVLDRLGLRNAWSGPANGFGFTSVGVERLAAMPEARFVHIGPVQSQAAKALADSRLWRSLSPVREGRMAVLPAVWFYGGLPAIGRFAGLMADASRADCPRG